MSMSKARTWQQLGAELSGIATRVGQERMQQQELDRRARLEAEAAAERKAAAESTRFREDLELARLGGGSGPVPKEITQIAGTGTGPVSPGFHEPAPLTPAGGIGMRVGGTAGMGITAPAAPAPIAAPALTDPLSYDAAVGKYQAVGSRGFIVRPEVAEAQKSHLEEERRLKRASDELQMKRETLEATIPAVTEDIRMVTGTSPARAGAAARLLVGHDVPLGQSFPREPADRTPSRDPGLPSFTKAYDIVTDKYKVPGEFQGEFTYSRTREQMIAEAQAMARGERYEAAPAAATPRPTDGPMGANWAEGMVRGFAGAPQQSIDAVIAKRAGDAAAPPTAAGSAPAPAGSGRQVITQDQADYLRTVRGMADAEIARLYEVR